MDDNGGLALEDKGAKEACSAFEDNLKQRLQVPILSTGHEETNVTVMMTAALDGTLPKPPFKAKYRELYDNWMVHGNREETPEGTSKPPSHEVYLQWIVEAWKSIPHEALAASFKTRGLATAADGREDHLLHCTKPKMDQPSPDALHWKRPAFSNGAALVEALLLDDEDAARLDVSNSDSSEDSDSDASIESESSSAAGSSQATTPQAGTSKAGGP
ncbi:transposase [Aphelenchoides avenae]|nr:transposase [Aphelenchus avenae]